MKVLYIGIVSLVLWGGWGLSRFTRGPGSQARATGLVQVALGILHKVPGKWQAGLEMETFRTDSKRVLSLYTEMVLGASLIPVQKEQRVL